MATSRAIRSSRWAVELPHRLGGHRGAVDFASVHRFEQLQRPDLATDQQRPSDIAHVVVELAVQPEHRRADGGAVVLLQGSQRRHAQDIIARMLDEIEQHRQRLRLLHLAEDLDVLQPLVGVRLGIGDDRQRLLDGLRPVLAQAEHDRTAGVFGQRLGQLGRQVAQRPAVERLLEAAQQLLGLSRRRAPAAAGGHR